MVITRMPEDQRSFSSYLFRRDLIQFQLANSRKIVSDLKQAGRGIDRGQGLCPPRYEHGKAADGHRPRSRRRSPRVSLLAQNLCRCRRVARPGFSPGAASAAGDRRCPAPSACVSPALSGQRAPENPAAAARPGQASRANTGRRRTRLRNLRMAALRSAAFSLSPNRLPKSTARSMRSRRSDVAQFAQIPSS